MAAFDRLVEWIGLLKLSRKSRSTALRSMIINVRIEIIAKIVGWIKSRFLDRSDRQRQN